MGLLQEARLAAITRLGEIAKQQEIGHVLVAGDVYDMENLSTRSLNQPLERMRGFDQVLWAPPARQSRSTETEWTLGPSDETGCTGQCKDLHRIQAHTV